MNGYRLVDTINFRKPAQFEIREGAVAQPQDVVEGKMPMWWTPRLGVDVLSPRRILPFQHQDMSSARY